MLDTFKHKGQRNRLVEELLDRGITDETVLEAIRRVPRHLFVQGVFQSEAYVNKPLPISSGQTISQPLTVAIQSQLLRLKKRMKVLEIGTGSGYQAAVLSEMGMRVFSVEIDQKLHREAKRRLEDLEYPVKLHHGDGSQGWPLHQPYERIIVTAASPSIPEPLKQQLEIGGILVIPVGSLKTQQMQVVTRLSRYEYEIETLTHFQFVPLKGKFGF
ncbi:MAG: protein-L-isoaspartate(D-aspartate) O-methyltransferase [Bacteroidota bacterium]